MVIAINLSDYCPGSRGSINLHSKVQPFIGGCILYTVNALYKSLSARLSSVTKEQNATAAVAVLLCPEEKGSLLFVKRVENQNDPWSGQMAFPGGKRENTDKSLKDTLIRETAEEVGIDIGACQILGVLNVLHSLPRPTMKILPFVIFCEHRPDVVLNKKELEEFVWISLKELAGSKGVYTYGRSQFPAYIVGDYTVWGLTYRIVQNLFHVLE